MTARCDPPIVIEMDIYSEIMETMFEIWQTSVPYARLLWQLDDYWCTLTNKYASIFDNTTCDRLQLPKPYKVYPARSSVQCIDAQGTSPNDIDWLYEDKDLHVVTNIANLCSHGEKIVFELGTTPDIPPGYYKLKLLSDELELIQLYKDKERGDGVYNTIFFQAKI